MTARLPTPVSALATRLVDAFAIGMGCWWLYSMLIVYTHQSFHTLMLGLALPALATAALCARWLRGEEEVDAQDAPAAAPMPRPVSALEWAGLAGVGLALLGWWWLKLPYLVAWVPMAAWSAWVLWRVGLEVAAPAAVGMSRRDAISLLLAMVVAFVLVSGFHRAEVDDAYHINAIISALEHPELAVLSFDGMHGDVGAPIQQLIHRPQTYEIFVAALAWLVPVDPRTLYWLVLPAMLAPLMTLSVWRLLKAISPNTAWLSLWLLFAVWLAWGDGYRTYGSYSFTRLFQGKPVFICLLVPAIWYSAARFASRPSPRSLGLLALTQCASVAFTSSALLLAPIAAGLALLAQLRPTRRGAAVFGAGLAASLPLVLVLLLVKLELSGVGGLRHDGWLRDMDAVLGTTARAPFALFALAALPALGLAAGEGRASWIARASAVSTLLVLNGWTAPFLAEHAAELFSWRLYWTLPLPLWVALGLALLGSLARSRARWGPRLAVIATLGALGLGFWSAGDRAYQRSGVHWEWWQHKLPWDHQRIARSVQHITEPTDLVLAAPRVAERIAGLDGRPRLLSVRESYLTNLSRYWGEEEAADRLAMMRLVSAKITATERDRGLEALRERCVAVIVVRRRTVHNELDLDGHIKALGYEGSSYSRKYAIYRRSGPPCAEGEARHTSLGPTTP